MIGLFFCACTVMKDQDCIVLVSLSQEDVCTSRSLHPKLSLSAPSSAGQKHPEQCGSEQDQTVTRAHASSVKGQVEQARSTLTKRLQQQGGTPQMARQPNPEFSMMRILVQRIWGKTGPILRTSQERGIMKAMTGSLKQIFLLLINGARDQEHRIKNKLNTLHCTI
jgi:hypothetical protein